MHPTLPVTTFMLRCFSMLLALFTPLLASAVTPPQTPQPLWSAGAVPLARGEDPEKDVPTLTPFWPDPAKATGAAIVICPGGGYYGLADHEGSDYARWLNERGVAAFVLRYRLGSAGYRHPAMQLDGQRAIRTVRAHAAEWGLDPARIGLMGSSAGGHLTATCLTLFDAGQPDAADPIERVSSRPDLGILCYPVITMGPLGHAGSRQNLLGDEPSPALVTLLSTEQQVSEATPPTFLWHTADDSVVPVENSLMFAAAMRAHQQPAELHIYPHGRHGLGLGIRQYQPGTSDPAQLLPWTVALEAWLRLQGFVR